jgi:hypothetical protein
MALSGPVLFVVRSGLLLGLGSHGCQRDALFVLEVRIHRVPHQRNGSLAQRLVGLLLEPGIGLRCVLFAMVSGSRHDDFRPCCRQ